MTDSFMEHPPRKHLPGTNPGRHSRTFFLDMFQEHNPGHVPGTYFLDIFQEHFSWTCFRNIFPGHSPRRLFLNIFQEDFSWRCCRNTLGVNIDWEQKH
jgi:hypothetical protein